MPGKVKVKILAGRNLPVMDRSGDTTDAYVEIKLGNTTFKTEVCRKSLNPQWNSEWYRFEMDDAELQDEPLRIRLMGRGTYSANDSIGKVYLNLNPLLLPPSPPGADVGLPINPARGGSTMSGWFPVYDTMHGIRGEVNVIVKVELFSDFNKFRQSSCGVQFFVSPTVPFGFDVHVIHGMVEELIVSGDPEYQWIEKIRAPRVTNESRQTIFLKLSGEVQRKIGLKVLDLGGNAVIGYKQCFDLEGESGIVVRGLGTAVSLSKVQPQTIPHPPLSAHPAVPICEDRANQEDGAAVASAAAAPAGGKLQPARPSSSVCSSVKTSQSPAKLNTIPGVHRRSSGSGLSVAPKGNSLTGSDGSSVYGGSRGFHSAFPGSTMLKEHLEMLEYPFLTMSKYPPGFIIHLGGVVGARSVKLLERMSNIEEPVCRDSWWTGIRREVRAHCRSLGCNVVLNYAESTSICDDVCVLSASGTAAVIHVKGEGTSTTTVVFAEPLEQPPGPSGQKKHTATQPIIASASVDKAESDPKPSVSQAATEPEASGAAGPSVAAGPSGSGAKPSAAGPSVPAGPSGSGAKPTRQRHLSDNLDTEGSLPCAICHVPYNHKTIQFHAKLFKCASCKKKMVSDVILASIELPEGLPIAGRGCFIQAFEIRPKAQSKGEAHAKEISDGLPFMEFEINKQLISKLRINGMNAVFGLKVEVCVGEKTVAAHATGTAFLITALPIPPVPAVAAGQTWQGDMKLAKVQQMLYDTVKKNRDFYQLKPPSISTQDNELQECSGDKGDRGDNSESEESEESDLPDLDPFHNNKDAFVLEVDDTHDADSISHLVDPHPPDGFHVFTLESLPHVEELEVVKNLQMFTQVWRSRLNNIRPAATLNKHFHRLLQGVYFKLRRMTPCALGSLRFQIDLPEQDELQISVVGMALGLAESDRVFGRREARKKIISSSANEGDMIFSLEEDVSESSAKPTKAPPVASAPATSSVTNVTPSTRLPRPHSPLAPHRRSTHTPPKERYGVDLTPLTYVPGGKIEKYLGNLNFYFIRESTCIREGGGLSGFVHSFVADVLAIVRAHVTALGGNAMVAYTMTDCTLLNYPTKNHAQCLVNVGGDAVFVSYFPED